MGTTAGGTDRFNRSYTYDPVGHPQTPLEGPCLGKLYDLVPLSTAESVIEQPDPDTGQLLKIGIRRMPSFEYTFISTAEEEQASLDKLTPGIFGIFPISGFALIEKADGSVHEQARQKMEQVGLKFYQSLE